MVISGLGPNLTNELCWLEVHSWFPELWLNLGDAHSQAARFPVSVVTSTPSLNLIPSMTFGGIVKLSAILVAKVGTPDLKQRLAHE
jgi:hypothetical protein